MEHYCLLLSPFTPLQRNNQCFVLAVESRTKTQGAIIGKAPPKKSLLPQQPPGQKPNQSCGIAHDWKYSIAGFLHCFECSEPKPCLNLSYTEAWWLIVCLQSHVPKDSASEQWWGSILILWQFFLVFFMTNERMSLSTDSHSSGYIKSTAIKFYWTLRETGLKLYFRKD